MGSAPHLTEPDCIAGTGVMREPSRGRFVRHRGKPRISAAAKYGRAYLASWPRLSLDMGL